MKRLFLIAVSLCIAGCGGGDGGGGDVPAAPTGLSVALGSNSGELLVSWTASEGATSYNLYWSNEAGVTAAASAHAIKVSADKAAGTGIAGATSPYSHTGLTNGTHYYYVVTAVNSAGESTASSEASGLPQVNPAGILDTTFAGAGYVHWGVTSDVGEGVEIDSEGRIVVAGWIIEGAESYNMALWRYNPDGTPDTTFGGDGLVTLHNIAGGNSWDRGRDVAVDSAGRYLVTGDSDNATAHKDMFLLRYNPDGTLDATFGTGGIIVYDRGVGANNWGYGVTLDSSGRILVAGVSDNAADNDMALWRYNADGSPDTTFGTNGVVFGHNAAGGGGSDSGNGLAIDSAGRIIVTGESRNALPNNDLVVWRYTDSGALDTSFNGTGIAVYDSGHGDDAGRGVTVDSEDRPLVTGEVSTVADADMVAMRYTSAGALDTAFGTGGIAAYDSGNADSGRGIAIDSRGRPMITGSSATTGNPENMVAARLTAAGAFDTTFDGDGVVVFNNSAIVDSADGGADITFDQAGRVVIGGQTGDYGNWYLMLWRYE